jgi:hypothetical protein
MENRLEKLQVDSLSNEFFAACESLLLPLHQKCSSSQKKLKTVQHFITMHAKRGGKITATVLVSLKYKKHPKSGTI